MEKAKNSSAWTEAGYDLFANEGMEGIQIERLARILGLNKSGFYHYFGDLDGYYAALLKLHVKRADLFLDGIREAKAIEPDYLELLIRFKVPMMFQMQMIRVKNNMAFNALAEAIDRKEDILLSKLWCDYLGVGNHSDLYIRFFSIVRDKFYARISFQNYTYQFLQDLLAEAKVLISQLVIQSA